MKIAGCMVAWICSPRGMNIIGLSLVTLAALIMWIYPPNVAQVTDEGAPLLGFTANPTRESVASARYQKLLRRLGPAFLVAGFGLQLWAALRD